MKITVLATIVVVVIVVVCYCSLSRLVVIGRKSAVLLAGFCVYIPTMQSKKGDKRTITRLKSVRTKYKPPG